MNTVKITEHNPNILEEVGLKMLALAVCSLYIKSTIKIKMIKKEAFIMH
jgi:hypothetical protein